MKNKKEYIKPLLTQFAVIDTDIILMSGSVFDPDEDELTKPVGDIQSVNQSSIFQTPGATLKSPDHIAPDNISGNTIF